MRRLCSGFSPRSLGLHFPTTAHARTQYSTLETTPTEYHDGPPPPQQAGLPFPTRRPYSDQKEELNSTESLTTKKRNGKLVKTAMITVEAEGQDAPSKNSGVPNALSKRQEKISTGEKNGRHGKERAGRERERERKRTLSKQLGLDDPPGVKANANPSPASTKPGRRKAARRKDKAQEDRPKRNEAVAARKAASKGHSRRREQLSAIPLTEDLCVDSLDFKSLPLDTTQVPPLCHGLDRVLFNPGVYHLQDPRSRIYNFDPYLEKVMPVREFDFDALSPFVTSSKDEKLNALAKKSGKKYSCSTSSITLVLSMFHRLLSYQRPLDISGFSTSLGTSISADCTPFYKAPAVIFLRHQEGRYAIDPDKEFDTENILSRLGHTLEKLLTRSVDDFERYRRSNPLKVSESERSSGETYNYATVGDFIMRSQLDASDPRLPGNGVFDLKTRAVHPIRMDLENYEEYSDYNLRHRLGEWESFEREYYDMMRGTMLKYSLQTRIGSMDGIFVAYHNVARIFGFQYISLQEMDGLLHGDKVSLNTGNAEFRLSMGLIQEVFERIIKKFPSQSVRIHFDANITAAGPGEMHIFAEPYTDAEIDASDAEKDRKAREFDRVLFSSKPVDTCEAMTPEYEESKATTSIEAKPKELEVSTDITSAGHSVESASAAAAELPKEWQEWKEEWSSSSPERELVGYRLRVDNYVNSQHVLRPKELANESDWTIKWGLEEMQDPKPPFLATVAKRTHASSVPNATISEKANFYRDHLRQITAESREWRIKQDIADDLAGRTLKVWHPQDVPRRSVPQDHNEGNEASQSGGTK